MASRLALQGEPTHTPVSRGALSSLHACWLSMEAGGHRSRPLFQGYAALGEFVHGELGRQTHHNTPPWTAPGASSPRGPRQPWMRPLLAAPPGLPDPPTPVPTLPCFPNGVCHAPPQAQGLPTQPQTRRQTKATPQPTRVPRSGHRLGRESFGPTAPPAPAAPGTEGISPPRGETPSSKHKPAGPARILLTQHRPGPALGRAASKERQQRLCLHRDGPCGVYGWGRRGREVPRLLEARARAASINPLMPSKGGDSAPCHRRRFPAPYSRSASP